ncbi:MAG: tol-pal system protein YbgF [Alphaproteobacteria bacterium]|nr:tol-pal system protein YbgF [Alphaproteobacteria bacterium]
MPLRHRLAAIVVAASAFVIALPAVAQDTRALMERIERLQRDVDVLQRRVASGGAGGGTGVPTLASPTPLGTPSEGFVGQTEQRFSAVESTNREQTGRIEELQFKLRQIEGKLDRLIGDIELRFQQIERGGAAGAPAAPRADGSPPPPPPASGTNANQRLTIVPSGTSAQALDQQRQQQAAATPRQPVQLPQGSPEAQYEFAYGLLLQAQRGRADFAPAAEAMQAFVAQNSSHRLAGNAQYWLGETHYVRKDWQNAALAFGEGLKKYPNAEKAPDNLLKLGMSLAQLNRKPDACAALGELDKRYPNAAAPVKQTGQRERQRIGC